MHSTLLCKHPSARLPQATENLISKTVVGMAHNVSWNIPARLAFYRLVGSIQTRTDLLDPSRLHGPRGLAQIQSILRASVHLALVYKRWLRQPETIQIANDAGARRPTPSQQLCRLIDHLLCKSTVPSFMYRVWTSDLVGATGDDHRLFLHLANGHSIRGTEKGADLTKPMAKRFLQAPPGCTIDQAIWFAKTGERPRTGREFPFATSRYRRKQIPPNRIWRSTSWAPIPVEGYKLDDDTVHPVFGRRTWTIRQLTTRGALNHESSRMRHCVGEYWNLCLLGKSSIWTMERKDISRTRAVLTIEVEPKSKSIVQIRGFANRDPRRHELEIVYHWARNEALRVALS